MNFINLICKDNFSPVSNIIKMSISVFVGTLQSLFSTSINYWVNNVCNAVLTCRNDMFLYFKD